MAWNLGLLPLACCWQSVCEISWRKVVGTGQEEGVGEEQEGDVVVDDGVDVEDIVGEAVALVVDGTLGEEDGGQVEHPAGERGLTCPNN